MAGEEAAVRVVAQFADHVHWVWEWPDKPTWRDRLRRLVSPESYRFEPSAPPAKPWVDRPAGHYERTGWRIRAAYYRSDLAFEVEYVVCDQCRIGWVESPIPTRATSAAAWPQPLSGFCAARIPGFSGTREAGTSGSPRPSGIPSAWTYPGAMPNRKGVITWNRGEHGRRVHDLAPGVSGAPDEGVR